MNDRLDIGERAINPNKKNPKNKNIMLPVTILVYSFVSAPEVVSFESLTVATDMWSIGVLTYIL